MARASTIAVGLVLASVVSTAVGGCGSSQDGSTESTQEPVVDRVAPEKVEPEETVVPARCPSEAGPGCREAEGRIIYVEAVDPDGDGDAHFVILDGGSVTLPGLTAIDVRRGLRPHPLPHDGDLISAAGPVQTGSHGQSQIHALVLNVATPAR